MTFKMCIQSSPRQVQFPIEAWHLVSPPVQYLDAFRLDDLDEYDANILAFDYILLLGRMSLSDIALSNDILGSLKPIQFNVPIKTTIKMQGVVRED